MGTLHRAFIKLSRNDLCPCKSGKKIKHCNCDTRKALNDKIDIQTLGIYRDGFIVGRLKRKEKDSE